MAKKAKRVIKKRLRKGPRKPNAALEAVKLESDRAFAQSDGRVIARQLALLLHEQQACEEHLAGLQASIVDVRARKKTVEARVAGLLQVQARR